MDVGTFKTFESIFQIVVDKHTRRIKYIIDKYIAIHNTYVLDIVLDMDLIVVSFRVSASYDCLCSNSRLNDDLISHQKSKHSNIQT